MRFPFTLDQFLDVFQRYNVAVWPLQWIMLALGVLAVVLALDGRQTTSRWVSGILALLWLWMATAYHLAFFARINRAAIGFAAAFAVQSMLFAWVAVRRPTVSYRPSSRVAATLGALMVTYAIVLYPAIGYAVGHRYPATPTFGAPCPTTILTLALIVWAGPSLPRRLRIVPLGWAIVGIGAAVNLGMIEDFGLLVAAIATVIWLPVGRGAQQGELSTGHVGAH
jgi:hypothetical protein